MPSALVCYTCSQERHCYKWIAACTLNMHKRLYSRACIAEQIA
jgi:hypothetical protein